MASILTRLVRITLFKSHTEQWLFCMCFILEKVSNLTNWIITGKIWKFLKPLFSHKNEYCYLSTVSYSLDVAISQHHVAFPFCWLNGNNEKSYRAHESNWIGFYSARYIYTLKLTVSLCFASQLIYKIIANANKLVIWVSCWNLEVPNYLSVSRSLKIT